VARDAIVLDLGDLARQGNNVRAAAASEANSILAAARAERARLIDGAYEEGFAKGREAGHREGLASGSREGAAAALAERKAGLLGVEQAWGAALDSFATQRDQMLLEARHDVLRLAVMLGERVTKRQVSIDPGSTAVAQLEAMLALLTRPTRLVVSVCPEDEDLVRAALPAVVSRFPAQHLELRADPSLGRGSCVARMAGGASIDASIETQLDRIVAALLPEGRAGGGDSEQLSEPAS